jgi:hypothetical protein
MSPGAFVLGFVILVMVAIVGYLVVTMVRSIHTETRSADIKALKHFGLSIVLCIMFFTSWIGQGLAQWQEFTDDQLAHKQTPKVGDFIARFSDSTLENWQSEFLQLFSFVVLSALLIHKGSAESKDSDERMEATLERIEKRLEAIDQRTG